MYLRPNGYASNVGQVLLDSAGAITVTGSLIKVDSDASAILMLDKGASGQYAYIESRMNGTVRWQMQLGNQIAESGSDAGSNFTLARFSDAGTLLDYPLTISRQTGVWTVTASSVTFSGSMVINSGLTITSGSIVCNGGNISVSQTFQSAGAACVLGTGTSGYVYLRPVAYNNSSGQTSIDSSGNMSVSGTLTTGGAITYNDGTVNYRVALVSAGQVYTGSFSNHPVNVQVNNSVVGAWSTTGLSLTGSMTVSNGLSVNGGNIACNGGVITSNQTFNVLGGTCIMGTASAGTIYLRPTAWNAVTGQMTLAAAGDGTWANDTQRKPTAGGFVATSDERIKTVQRDYTTGLAAINALRPVVFVFKGNDTDHPPDEDPAMASLSDEEKDAATKPGVAFNTVPYPRSTHYQLAVDGTERIGMVAQEIEQVLPETITQRAAYIDGQPVSDLREFDPTNIIYALINAVKELSARLEALEGAR
jgi:hypothetical protein